MKSACLVILMLSVFCVKNNAQTYNAKAEAGFGFGLEYGGDIGAKISYLPTKWLGLFGSVGLYYYTGGYSFGAQLILPAKKKVGAYLIGMYGVNGGLDTEVFITTKQYFGTTFGGGISIHTRRRNAFWNINLLMPFRDDQLQMDVDDFQSKGLKVNYSSWPVNFSIGYHIGIDFNTNKL